MGLQTLVINSVNGLKNLKGIRNKNLNPWPSIIMLLLLFAVGIFCVFCK